MYLLKQDTCRIIRFLSLLVLANSHSRFIMAFQFFTNSETIINFENFTKILGKFTNTISKADFEQNLKKFWKKYNDDFEQNLKKFKKKSEW